MASENTNDTLKAGARKAMAVGSVAFKYARATAVQLTKLAIAGWKASAAHYGEFKRKQEAQQAELARQQEADRAEQARLAQERARQLEERRVKHSLKTLRCKVIDTPQRYRRPNADGSRYFEGTELKLMNAYEGARLDLSFEDLFGFAAEGDIIDVVLATVRYQIFNQDFALPVLVINRARGGYHLVNANIAKHNDDTLGGERQLRKDLENYSVQELNINFV